MISIVRATEKNYKSIVEIGRISVAEAHKNSCPDEDLNFYIANNYNDDAIRSEVCDRDNIYFIIKFDDVAAGFSKINLNANHKSIAAENVTKLDRIYLLKAFQDLKLGRELLSYNIDFCRKNNQSGIWLYTWIGNAKAINFYQKASFKIIGSHDFYVTKTTSNVNHQMFLRFD